MSFPLLQRVRNREAVPALISWHVWCIGWRVQFTRETDSRNHAPVLTGTAVRGGQVVGMFSVMYQISRHRPCIGWGVELRFMVCQPVPSLAILESKKF